MKHSMMFVAAVFAFAATTTAPAAAREAQFSRADLNMSSSQGIEVFNARVRSAARVACGERTGPVSFREYAQVRACKRDFIQSYAST